MRCNNAEQISLCCVLHPFIDMKAGEDVTYHKIALNGIHSRDVQITYIMSPCRAAGILGDVDSQMPNN